MISRYITVECHSEFLFNSFVSKTKFLPVSPNTIFSEDSSTGSFPIIRSFWQRLFQCDLTKKHFIIEISSKDSVLYLLFVNQ